MKAVFRIGFAVALGLTSIAAGQARAGNITTLYNTGVDASHTILPNGTVGDPHYQLTSVPLGSATQTLIRTSAGGFPIPPYLGDDSLSTWIGPNKDQQLDGPGGLYDYQTTFSLTGFNPATALINGVWSTDNTGYDILINGHSTNQTIAYGSPGSYSFESFHAFSISSFFVAGVNTIDFLVFNGNKVDDTNGPTALRVEMTGTAAVPEPATFIMGGTALLTGLGLCLRRRKTSNA